MLSISCINNHDTPQNEERLCSNRVHLEMGLHSLYHSTYHSLRHLSRAWEKIFLPSPEVGTVLMFLGWLHCFLQHTFLPPFPDFFCNFQFVGRGSNVSFVSKCHCMKLEVNRVLLPLVCHLCNVLA